ncbi:MAG: hypothetical protein PHU80_06530 [Kiritimatiellae bacterium]|nr:hypothetical protein [Kiritimatiellia bacterium]
MRDFYCGGVARRHEMGELDIAAGVPVVSRGQVLSQTGWGSRAQLTSAAVGAKGTDVPQLWLCGGSGGLPPVYQRFLADGCEVRLVRRHDCTVGVYYADDYADYCLLTGVLPPDIQASREQQTTAVFEGIEDALLMRA